MTISKNFFFDFGQYDAKIVQVCLNIPILIIIAGGAGHQT